jgi:hypothetical protein
MKQINKKSLRISGHPVVRLVEALRFKPESRGFDSRWCHWNFSFPQSFRPHYGPGVDSPSNRNEYQEYLLGGGGKVGRCIRLTTLSPSCAEYLEIWEPQTPGIIWASNRPPQGLFDLYLAYLWMSVCTIAWRIQRCQVRNTAGTCAALTALLNPRTCRGFRWITSPPLPF